MNSAPTTDHFRRRWLCFGWQYVGVWYPFKFWRNLSYQCIDGVLAEELGMSSSPTWRHRRRARLARRNNPDFLVAVVDGASGPVVEGWLDTPHHRFKEIVLRLEVSNGGYFWINTSEREHSSMFPVSSNDPHASIECRSGTMVAWATTIGGRSVNILHRPGAVITEGQLRLVTLDSIGNGKA